MGDMADFALEEVYDFEDSRSDFNRGLLPIEEAIERGVCDEQGFFIEPRSGHTRIKTRTCRCCGKNGLRWYKLDGRWRLFEGESIHNCPSNPLEP
jgi:hypothetical protein